MSSKESVEIKVAKHGQILSDHERRIRIQEEKVDNLRDISATLKELTKQNERNEKRFEQVTVVLDGINTNLLSLNHDVKHLKDRQEAMDNKVGKLEKEKIKELEDIKRQREEERREARKERRDFILKVISGVAVTVLGAVLLLWLGLN